MQLKLKIEQLVCHWRVKMLQAQSVFTGERLTLLNSPPPLPFQTSWATQYFEHVLEAAIWDLNIEYLDCQWLQAQSVFTGSHFWTSSLAFRHDVPPSISYPIFWTCSGGSHLRLVHDNVIAFEICADARLSRICSAWFTGQLSSSAEPPSTTFLHIKARLIGNNAACVPVFCLYFCIHRNYISSFFGHFKTCIIALWVNFWGILIFENAVKWLIVLYLCVPVDISQQGFHCKNHDIEIDKTIKDTSHHRKGKEWQHQDLQSVLK